MTKDQQVYTLSYDSKILSGIFEIFCEPLIRDIAYKFGFEIEKTAQNSYPDFTLYKKDAPDSKIAIEIKSTYRQFKGNGKLKKFSFTLGSYRSYLRDSEGKRGILYPYKDYVKHWVIGFLYSRNPECEETEIRRVIEASQLKAPFMDVEYFVQEKFKIAGERPGSGNTTNIGSIKSSDINDFKKGNGPFKTRVDFEKYWRNY